MPRIRIHLLWLLGGVILTGCNTSSISLDVLQPSQIVLPDYAQTIAIVDRSRPSQGFRALNNVATLYAKDLSFDREGRQRALGGLTQALSKTPRFIIRPTGQELTNQVDGRTISTPLTWREVEELCRRHQADLLLVLESYDPNLEITYKSSKSKQKDKATGQEVEKIRYTATRSNRLYLGWRVYDPKAKAILDESAIPETDEQTNTGDTEEAARLGLSNPLDPYRRLAERAGQRYAQRIAPLYITVSRSYFNTVKGPDQAKMEEAHRFTRVDQWDEAQGIWLELEKKADDPRTRGKAAVNLAVAAEREGLLQKALNWARQAYTRHGHRAAQSYITILEQRLADQERLRQQYQAKP